jgi:hypothetical protein
MRQTATLTVPDQHRMARAFLALTDDPAAEAVQRSLVKGIAAFAAALVIALAAPVMWFPAAPAVPGKLGEAPAATLGNSKAALAAADDEDAAGAD